MDRVIGVDVGGTKIAAGLVRMRDGLVEDRVERPTRPDRGGAAVLADVSAIVADLSGIDGDAGVPGRIGVAVCELVDPHGRVTSDQTLDWVDRDIAGALPAGAAVVVASDVRAGALAESRLGAGVSLDPFLYVSVGTGVSHTLVQAGVPYAGRHGTALIAATGAISAICPRCAQPIDLVPEEIASGRGMVARYAASGHGGRLERAEDVVAAADAGDAIAAGIVEEGGAMLGVIVGGLVNVLDPEGVVIGGGLGLTRGRYRDRFLSSFTEHVWAPTSRDTTVVDATLGTDAVLVGAALTAAAAAPAQGEPT